MTKEIPQHLPDTTHGFFEYVIAHFGREILTGTLGISTGTAYRYAEDPELQEEPRRNPLDNLRSLFKKLDRAGHRNAAKTALRLMAGGIRCQVFDCSVVMPGRETVPEEWFETQQALAEFQKGMDENLTRLEVAARMDKVITEMRESVTLWEEKRE